jgi:hypothetical protein
MKERPILFSAPMIRAILEDRKGVTRRIVVPQPPSSRIARELDTHSVKPLESGDWGAFDDGGGLLEIVKPKYGQPGDRLWVRERMRVVGRRPLVTGRARSICVRYEADNAPSGILPYPERLKHEPLIGKCLPYGGYREASRILLDVLDVRVERLQEIDHTDAEREGVEPDEPGFSAVPPFARLWNEINARRGYSWEKNPWVWRIAFRKAQTS